MLMKKQFLKSVLALGAALALVNCSEEAADAINNLNPEALIPASSASENAVVSPDDACWLMEANGAQYLIYPSGIVTDINGTPIAQATLTPDETGTSYIGTITALDAEGTPLFNINTADLEVVSLAQLNPVLSSSATELPPASSATVPGLSSATVPTLSSSSLQTLPGVSSSSEQAVVTSSSSENRAESSSSNQQQQTQSSAAVSGNCDGQCFDNASSRCVDYHSNLKGPNEEQYAYDESCKLNCYYDPTGKNCQNMTGKAPASSSAQQPKSSSSAKSSSSQQQQSSSSVKSSSSSAKSSSSVKSSSSQSSPNASAEEAKYLNAGEGGQQGYATRYWDCCMPHCAWPEHGGAAKTCDAKGKTPIGNTNGSFCSGGQGTTCTSQIPIIVSDKLAYAFAATPGNDATCGKCFALTFTGTGKYETKANHQALKGKTLVVMASNIGYDVQGGQFDIMIPGGGVGLFNGCSQMGWGSQGATYGGLLTDCENEVGYNGDLLTKRKQCLTEKCNSSFANDDQAREGCLFLATWMEAAGNPNHTYKEVDCPAALQAQF